MVFDVVSGITSSSNQHGTVETRLKTYKKAIRYNYPKPVIVIFLSSFALMNCGQAALFLQDKV